MDKREDKTEKSVAKNGKEGGEKETAQVVMRRPRHVLEPANRDSADHKDGSCDTGPCGEGGYKTHKHVKWSESTDMRERLKVYRRSQLDIPLDYHHLEMEEKLEKEGVQIWRNHIQVKDDDDDNDEENTDNVCDKEAQSLSASGGDDVSDTAAVETGDQSDSDDTDPNFDDDLERKLQVIKEETTRFTLYPAYSAAISVYEDWLSHPNHTTRLTDDQMRTMTSQLNLYKRLVEIYREWTQQTSTNIPKESRFGEITLLLQEASNLGQPPSCVSKVIREVLNEEQNIQKQVDAYNTQVQDMIAALDITKKV